MQFQMRLQPMVVPIISEMLLMSAAIELVHSHPRASFLLATGNEHPRQKTSVLSARYMYARMYECARFQPVLHVRITRNDRPGRFPLTLGAPAFLLGDRLLLNGHLITWSTEDKDWGRAEEAVSSSAI